MKLDLDGLDGVVRRAARRETRRPTTRPGVGEAWVAPRPSSTLLGVGEAWTPPERGVPPVSLPPPMVDDEATVVDGRRPVAPWPRRRIAAAAALAALLLAVVLWPSPPAAAPTARSPGPVTISPGVAMALAAPEVVAAPPARERTAPLRYALAGALGEPAGAAELRRFAVELDAACAGRAIVLTGHTCDLGREPRNLALGRARAARVRQLLVAAGVREDIEIRSAGSGEPIDSNATEAGRQRNRRVTATCSDEVK